MTPNASIFSILRNTLLASLVAGCCLVLGEGASAQALGPYPVIAGLQVQCGGVPTFVQPIPDIAMARPGVIVLNPKLFELPGSLKLFVYAHECAHHLLGNNEANADCWAIRTGRQQGWFKPSDISYLIQYFGNSPGDWTHAPGPYRIANMMACFSTASRTISDEGVEDRL